MLWILVQTSFFQNYIVHRVAHRLSKNLNTTVSIKKIDIELFDKMDLQGLLILDHKKDTLLYAGDAKVTITDWFFFKENISLQYIGLYDAFVNLYRTDSTWNYQFLVDYFSGPKKQKDTSSTAINLDLKVLNLKNVKVWQRDEWRGENILASVAQLNIHADQFDINKKVIRISSFLLDHPSFSMYDYTGKEPADTTSNSNTDSSSIKTDTPWNSDGWQLFVENLSLKDGLAAIEKQGSTHPLMNVFDDSHIILSDINATFKNTSLINDTLKAAISVSTKDRGGFVIKNLSGQWKFTPQIMEFKNFDLRTNKSHLQNYFAMHYHHFNDDMQDFVHAVNLEARFENSILSSEDIAYFAPDVHTWNTVFTLNGEVHGTIDNLSARKMIISAGNETYLD